MSTFYMPPPSVRTRILDHSGRLALSKGPQEHHSQTGNYTSVVLVGSNNDGDDQYWSLEHNENGSTCCLMRNKGNNLVILVSGPPAPFMLANGRLGQASSCR